MADIKGVTGLVTVGNCRCLKPPTIHRIMVVDDLYVAVDSGGIDFPLAITIPIPPSELPSWDFDCSDCFWGAYDLKLQWITVSRFEDNVSIWAFYR